MAGNLADEHVCLSPVLFKTLLKENQQNCVKITRCGLRTCYPGTKRSVFSSRAVWITNRDPVSKRRHQAKDREKRTNRIRVDLTSEQRMGTCKCLAQETMPCSGYTATPATPSVQYTQSKAMSPSNALRDVSHSAARLPPGMEHPQVCLLCPFFPQHLRVPMTS